MNGSASLSSAWKTPHGLGGRDASGKVGGSGGGEFALRANSWQTPATDSFRSRGGERQDEPGLDRQAATFWPSPRAEDAECIGNHPGQQDSLYAESQLWPTPQAHDVQTRGNTEADHHHHPHDLSNATELWATPNSRDEKNPRSPDGPSAQRKVDQAWTVDLNDQAVMWPTPDANSFNETESVESFEARKVRNKARHHNNGMGTPLGMAAKAWPTPTAQDSEASGSRRSSRAHMGTSLTDASCRPSHPDPAPPTTGGASSPPTPASRRRLNPRFVSWLMGWPLLGRAGSDSSATGWFPYRRRMRSVLSGLVGR